MARSYKDEYIENFEGDRALGDFAAPPPAMTPPPATATATTTTTAAPAGPAGPWFDGRALDRMDQTADDLEDDWEQWMYPELKEGLFRDQQMREQMINQSGAAGHNIDLTAHRVLGTADTMEDMNNQVYIPQARRIVDDASQYDRAGYAERGVKTALGDMAAAFRNDRDATQMRNAQYGIDPTSGRAMSMDRIAQIMHGANTAGAANRARQAAEEIWGKKQMDAMNTSGLLNQNASTIGALRNTATNMFTGALGARKVGADATNQYFTNVNDLAGRRTQVGTALGGIRNDAGNMRLGLYKTETDRDLTKAAHEVQRYGIDKDFEASKYAADRQAEAARAQASAAKRSGNASAGGSIIGAAIALF